MILFHRIADEYSIPALLFLLLVGVLPFSAVSAEQLPAPEGLRTESPSGNSNPGAETGSRPGSAIKWYPGHYGHAGRSEDLPDILRQIRGFPIVRGVQVRYYWDELEPRRNQYDFSKIQRDIALLGEEGKVLGIQLQYKTFGGSPRIPGYLKSEEFEGGSYQGYNGDWNLRLWNKNVRSRLHSLIRALGASFDDNSGLAVINTVESGPTRGVDGDLANRWSYYKSQYFRYLFELAPMLREAFPRTPVVMYFNSGPNEAEEFAEVIKTHGVGAGGPDTYVGAIEYDLWGRHGYRAAIEVQGLVPIGQGVQWNNYVSQGKKIPHDNPEDPVPALYAFNRDVLGSNFIFWEKRKAYWDGVTALWASFDGSDPAGGLRARCPQLVAPCYSD